MADPSSHTPEVHRRSLIDRLLGRGARTNGTALKSSGVSGVTFAPGLSFFSDDGTKTIIRLVGGANSEAERVSVATAYAAAAYAFVALRYRAKRMAEPPLMVIAEDAKDGSEKWLPTHALADLLDAPSPDYDMGELLFRTSISVDRTGHALWLKDPNGLGRPGRLQLFSGGEFEVKSTREQLRGSYLLSTARGQKTYAPEQVIYFHEPNPDSWLDGLSRVEVMLGWLNLGQQARATVRDLLDNSVWPSIILKPDKDWNPSPAELETYKAQADAYGQKKGGALPMLGGGDAEVVSARIKDLIPDDILNRVESVVSSVFGIPAVVLQFQVGMENSPWSQMADARRMCYEDTVEPDLWRPVEKLLTRQLLRPMDADPTHFIRFDTSRIRALQADRLEQGQIATLAGRFTSVNERRTLMGFEPVDDPAADEIPELRPPPPSPFDATGDGTSGDQPAKARPFGQKVKRTLQALLRADQVQAAEFEWQLAAGKQLEADAAAIAHLAQQHLAEKDETPTPSARRRLIAAVETYLDGEGKTRWAKAVDPLIGKTARRAASTMASTLGVSFDLLRPGVLAYTKREAAWLVTGLNRTTRDAVADAVAQGIEQGLGARGIAKALRELPAFDRDRALLVARTESTRVHNGAPTESLKLVQAETGRVFLKRWNTAGDDRVRDEHAAMEGETVPLDASFSNGLDFPSEPNCRCVLTYEEAPE